MTNRPGLPLCDLLCGNLSLATQRATKGCSLHFGPTPLPYPQEPHHVPSVLPTVWPVGQVLMGCSRNAFHVRCVGWTSSRCATPRTGVTGMVIVMRAGGRWRDASRQGLKQSLPAGYVPVSACGGCLKKLKDLKGLPADPFHGGVRLSSEYRNIKDRTDAGRQRDLGQSKPGQWHARGVAAPLARPRRLLLRPGMPQRAGLVQRASLTAPVRDAGYGQ